MFKVVRVAVALPGLVPAALVVSSCANPVSTVTQNATEQLVESSTGVRVSTDAGSGASLPKDWPAIPTPSADPTLAMAAEDGFLVTFVSSEDEVARIQQEFEQQGYVQAFSADCGEMGKMASWQDEQWSVVLMYGDDGEGQYMLNYTVTPTSGQA